MIHVSHDIGATFNIFVIHVSHMETQEPKVKINARIDADLHKWILTEGMTVSQAAQQGITLLRETRIRACDTQEDNDKQGSTQARDTQYIDNDVNISQALRERIEDLRGHIELMSEQLSRKDDQITKLNELTQNQVINIQYLMQENSKLNMKLLPEATTNKKSWWKFW